MSTAAEMTSSARRAAVHHRRVQNRAGQHERGSFELRPAQSRREELAHHPLPVADDLVADLGHFGVRGGQLGQCGQRAIDASALDHGAEGGQLLDQIRADVAGGGVVMGIAEAPSTGRSRPIPASNR